MTCGLPVTVTVERGQCCPDWPIMLVNDVAVPALIHMLVNGACLSLLQWSVDSAALIGYHVGQ